MTLIKTKHNRRSFLKVSAASTGGLMIGFSWVVSCNPVSEVTEHKPPSEWFDINAFLSIADNGQVTVMSPNPEIGQNVKTSMPMIVAEELDVNWEDVIVKQAALNTDAFTRQVAGGSQSIRKGWNGLRMAGATARKMLVNAAAKQWNVNPDVLKTENGVITRPDGKKLSYAEVASSAAGMEIPDEVELKDPENFKIVGTSRGNVDIESIITGKPLFGIDTKREGMQYAVVLRPPAFGMKLKSFDDTKTKTINGVSQVVEFDNKIAVLANSTWAAMKGQKALEAKWQTDGNLEDSDFHDRTLLALLNKKADTDSHARKDGEVENKFKEADEIVERTYEAPFLPHNCLEPMNFFADVTDEKIDLYGPIQTPAGTRRRIAKEFERDESEISVGMSRMGGGFGRRLYGDFAVEAAKISDKIRKPVQVMFSRENDMTAGIYRPATKYKIKAGLKEGKITSYQLIEAAINNNMYGRLPNNFPAGALADYQVDNHRYESNISTGAWRAPYTNFLAFAEQTFLDEIATLTNTDPLELRIQLLKQAKKGVGPEGNYDPDKFIGVIKLAADKAGWRKNKDGIFQGFSAYYSHNTYVAEVAEVIMEKNRPKVTKMTVAIDCGIVVNPIAAINQAKGGVIDGIGHAMYGDFGFTQGTPHASNFDRYRLIRMPEAPEVDIHFVESFNAPTGLGEPTLPPAGGALANAIYAATGKRLYKQPFIKQDFVLE
ncbi:xanthine dehydrogenase family protein molybdopterin-binding subunit [Fulvivirga sp. M361]|uniref:xanthine dehydrogenase family protein molybdopterin-binding subunit n=1 Tax=Fulvivirga sp. M361 TaxID=2594266 RepID=UPI00117B411E|nr:molybdopterin cofactor-binding domain-containing protein [Fulvivirga sp. M361]TRX52453.1 xanthine dehydrogenase family protein molybdopterin-binding subunit [Fulvivirga sp. M361]